MTDLLFGMAIGAACVPFASFLLGFVSEWRRDVGRRNYEEFKRIEEEFDRRKALLEQMQVNEQRIKELESRSKHD